MTKPIEIFVRQCYHSPNSNIPGRNRPEWFDKNAVFRNLKYTADPELANITVIYDSYFGQPLNWKVLNKVPENYHVINCGNEAPSFLAMLDIIMSKNLPDDTIVYLLEDDYLHREGWCTVLLEAFTLPGVKYATLYDHKDKYMHYPELSSKIFATKSSHWRTTPSTTNTYACRIETLRNEIEKHREFSIGRDVTDDNGKFLKLGNLVSSIPGWSTHCDDYMSPTIDWERIMHYKTYG